MDQTGPLQACGDSRPKLALFDCFEKHKRRPTIGTPFV